MKIRLITLLVLGALLHGHAHAFPRAQQIGTYYTVKIDHSLRGYKVYTPKGYDPQASTKYRVVFLLHGDSSAPEFLADTMSHFIAKADAEKFILVLPQAMYDSDGNKLEPTANPMDPKNPALGLFNVLEAPLKRISWNLRKETVNQELFFLETLCNHLSSDFKADSDRFYLVGHSGGAFLTQYAAMKLNHVFAAFASIAGQGPKELVYSGKTIKLATWRPSFRVPILLMNATEDPNVPYLEPYDARYFNVMYTVGCWLGVNKSDGRSVSSKIDTIDESLDPSNDGSNLSVDNLKFRNGKVNFYAVMGGGHHWHMPDPLGFSLTDEVYQSYTQTNDKSPLPPETLCKDINTTDVVWNFFKNRRKSQNGTIPAP